MSKQDGYASRTPADLERKYKFGETFAEVFGLVSDARKIAKEAQSAIEGLDQEQIFNLLTNNGKAQGIYRDDKGDVYVNASYIKSGKLASEYIDATNLKVSAANITGTLVVGEQLPDNLAVKSDIPTKTSQLTNNSGFVAESGVTSIVEGVVTADYVNALGLKVKAANITGTLTIGQLPSTVAKKSDLSGFVDEATVTTITNTAISTATISADQIYGGTLEGVTLKSSGYGFGDVEISGANISVGSGDIYSQYGQTFIVDYGGITLSTGYDLVLQGGSVQISLDGGTSYWDFSRTGIFLRNSSGTIINRVQLV